MLMNFIFALAAFAVGAFAQSVVIAAPDAFTNLTAGQSFTVDIARPVRLPTFSNPSK